MHSRPNGDPRHWDRNVVKIGQLVIRRSATYSDFTIADVDRHIQQS